MKKELCLKYKSSEKVLPQHAQDTLEEKFTAAFADKNTDLIAIDILLTLNDLFVISAKSCEKRYLKKNLKQYL